MTMHIWIEESNGDRPIVLREGRVSSLVDEATTRGADRPSATPVDGPEPVDTVVGTSQQGISVEESSNSYIKQFGRFTVHDDPPPDTWPMATTAKAYALTLSDGTFVTAGEKNYGAEPGEMIRGYLSCNPPTRLYTTERDFAALVDVGGASRLMVWGGSINTAQIASPLAGIRFVYANRYAFAFIYELALPDGRRIGAIGAAKKGGEIPANIHLKLSNDEPVSIHANEEAFVVVTRSGKVHAWGAPTNGGVIPDDTAAILAGTRVEKIFASSFAFCAVGQDGAPIAWGNSAYGGSMPTTKLETILDDDGVDTIVASQFAFCCITRRRRKAVAWGSAGHGGTMNASATSFCASGDIVACKASSWAFCAVNRSGQATAWGLATHGGTLAPTSGMGIQSNADASDAAAAEIDTQAEIRAALSDASAAILAADDERGSSFTTPEWTAHLAANDSGFCLLTTFPDTRIRSVVAWGAADILPTDAVKQVLLGSFLERLVTSNRAFLAIVRQGRCGGRAVAWGEPNANGGRIPVEVAAALSSGIDDARPLTAMPVVPTDAVDSNTSGFRVRCTDGSVVLWGGATGAGFPGRTTTASSE